VVKTLDKNTLLVKNLTAESTVLELKKRIHLEWTGTSPGKQQLLFRTVDLVDDTRTLGSYGVFGPQTGSGAESGTDGPGSGTGTDIPVITMYSLVNMLTHQGRFINLQRYVWSGGALKVLSPLAAVDDVKSLQDGVLASSSLSMTSRDSFLLWEEMNRYCLCIFLHFF
jgi:Ubiquitin family